MDYKFWVSIYAAVVATVGILWRLYEFYIDRRGKLKVINSYTHQLPIYSNKEVGDLKKIFVVSITNHSKNKRQIKIPRFKLDINVNGKKYFNFLDFDTNENFPKALDTGDEYQYKISSDVIDRELKKEGVSKIKTIIIDTYGKKYYSNWFKI